MPRFATRPPAPGREAMRRAREANNLTYQDAARLFQKLGHPVRGNTIARYEVGQRSVDTETLLTMARAYNATPNQLLGFERLDPKANTEMVPRAPVEAALQSVLPMKLDMKPELVAEVVMLVAEILSQNGHDPNEVAEIAAKTVMKLRR